MDLILGVRIIYEDGPILRAVVGEVSEMKADIAVNLTKRGWPAVAVKARLN